MKIPLARVHIDDAVKQHLMAAVDSENYILGRECEAFEKELAAHTGAKHCILSTSWTAAVHLLLYALKLKPGYEIIVPSHTAFPSIEPIIQTGGKPVFIDIDESYTLDVNQVEKLITPRTVGIMPVHLYGHPCDNERIKAIAERHGLFWIEDCAQAHGAEYRGRKVGSWGTYSAFSFFPSKNLTVFGDGGCVMLNDDALAEKIRMLRNHGRKDKFTHEFPGFNQRFNEIQAAIGREQLKRLDEFNAKRRQVAAWYRARLKDVPGIQLPIERPGCVPVYHMFVCQVDRRDELIKFLKTKDIGTGIHYPIANHQQPAITNLYHDLPKLPVTEAAVKRIVSLPMFPKLKEEEVDYVCEQIKAFLKK